MGVFHGFFLHYTTGTKLRNALHLRKHMNLFSDLVNST